MLENLRYAVDGARDGMAWREDREARAAAAQRQAELDAQAQERYGMQLAEHQADRAQAEADRTEFDLPEKRARAGATKRQEKERVGREKAAAAYEALLRGDTKPTEDFYTNDVPDGHDVKLQFLPDGSIQMQHPNGTAVAKSADELWFGKEDGTGLGLYQVAFPDQAIETVQAGRKERKDRATKLEDETRSNNQRMREIGASRAPMPQYAMDADGNMGQVDGTSFRPVTGPDGKPMRGSIGGRGGVGRDTRTALQKNLEYRAQLAIARDQSGALADMEPNEVAGMVEAMDQAGKSRSEQMKVALSMMNAAYSEFEDPAAITARASALVDAIGQIAGPAPTMHGIDHQAPPGGNNPNDPLRIR